LARSFETSGDFFDQLPSLYRELGGTAPSECLVVVARSWRDGATLARFSDDFRSRLASCDEHAAAADWSATRGFNRGRLAAWRGPDSQLWIRVGLWKGQALRSLEGGEGLYSWRGVGVVPVVNAGLRERVVNMIEKSTSDE
jgi:hypothetical protein